MVITLLIIASFSAGFIDSIAGGGGLILIPSLLLSGIAPQTAITTNKFVAPWGTGMALWNFARSNNIFWKIPLFGIAFTFLGTFLGSKTLLAIDQKLVAKIIIPLLIFAAIINFLPKKNSLEEKTHFTKKDLYLVTPLLCLSIGFYDGIFGPGTGTLLILGLHWFLKLNLLKSSGTAKVMNFASNIGALAIFIYEGKILYEIGIPLAIANIAGGYLGSHLTIKKGDKIVKIFLAISMIILIGSLLWKYIFSGQ